MSRVVVIVCNEVGCRIHSSVDTRSCLACFLPFPFSKVTHLSCGSVFQTVEEIEGVLGRDLYPNLAEERSRWEKELAGLREENESLTAMLCSKEEELNRTKATMNAIREERDRLRRRVSAPRPASLGLSLRGRKASSQELRGVCGLGNGHPFLVLKPFLKGK